MPQDMMTAMKWAGDFLEGTMDDWPEIYYKYSKSDYLKWRNHYPPELAAGGGKDKLRGRAGNVMAWKLAPVEAHITEFEPAGCFWMVTNMGAFSSSMDFLYRPVSYTPARTKVDSDGKVRLIMCHDDPGYHNWMDTQHFEEGQACFRTILSDTMPELTTRVVKVSELASVLPRDSVKVTPEERAHQMHQRFDAIRMRYGL
jgi:hypothetical protein